MQSDGTFVANANEQPACCIDEGHYVRGIAMRFLRSLLIAFIVVNFCNAQENSDRSPKEVGGEMPVGDISEPNAGELQRANNGDRRSLAALEALEEGNDLWRSGNIEQSSISYQRAINLDPSFYSAQFNLGLTLLQTNEHDRAVLAFTEALRLRPESAAAWQSLGFAHYYSKHYDEAVEAFSEARRLNPKEAETSNNMGFAYLFVHRFEDAIASFRNALQLDSQFSYAINGLCIAQALAKRPEAIAACKRAATADRGSAAPHYFLGTSYMDLGENRKALRAFQQAARIEPRTARIHIGLGFACFKLEQYEEALKHFARAQKLNARAEHALLGLGVAYAQLKEYEKAERALREAIAADPDNPVARFNLGIVCLARGNQDCALSQYNRLKIMGHTLGKTLFTTIFRGRVVDASFYNKP